MEILVAGWDSGGGVEAVQTVVRRAAERGHHVRVLGTEGLRSRFESAGAEFRRYRYAPDNDSRSTQTDIVKEWEARTTLGVFARVRDRVDIESIPEIRAALDDARSTLDGRGRLVVRYSGTEPVLRVMAEGPDETEVSRLVDAIIERVSERLG